MKKLITLLTLLIVLHKPSGAVNIVPDSVVALYQKLNNAEQRLIDFKDSDKDLKLKLEQLQIINESRVKHQSGEVKLDILASRMANKMCKEAALNNYTGHWNMAGEKPYQRYAFAGGLDHVSENASGKSTNGEFAQNDNTVLSSMKELHHLFMSESAPNDGHKINCTDKRHNYVGIGFYLTAQQFRYYEEFIDRYYSFADVPVKVKVNQEFSLKLKTEAGWYLCYLVAYKDKAPKKIKAAKISLKHSYKDYTKKTALVVKPWSFVNYKFEGVYKIPLKFEKAGLYYIQIYQDQKEYRTPKNFNTEGKIQASGVVITVEE